MANSLEIEITEQSLKWTNTRLTFFPFIHQPSRLQELRNSLRWPIYVINSGDKTKLSCYSHHLRSTRFSLKTYALCYKKINDFNDNRYITEICWEATERLNCILKQILMIRDSSAFHSFSIVTWSWYGQYKTRLQFSTLAPFITFKSITSKRLWTKFTIPRSPHFTFVLKTHLNCKESSVQFY